MAKESAESVVAELEKKANNKKEKESYNPETASEVKKGKSKMYVNGIQINREDF